MTMKCSLSHGTCDISKISQQIILKWDDSKQEKFSDYPIFKGSYVSLILIGLSFFDMYKLGGGQGMPSPVYLRR